MGKPNAKRAMRELAAAASHNAKDIDVGHKAADEALCKFVENEGYPGVAAAYRGVDKLYD